jgi:hypothetical protein
MYAHLCLAGKQKLLFRNELIDASSWNYFVGLLFFTVGPLFDKFLWTVSDVTGKDPLEIPRGVF